MTKTHAKKILLALAALIVAGCTHNQPKTHYYLEPELSFCDREPNATICIGIFKKTAAELLDNYDYVSDLDAHGRDDVWSALMHVDGRKKGDCEDCAISLADALVSAGLPAHNITLHLAKSGKHALPDHIMLSYGAYFVDCKQKKVSKTTQYEIVAFRKIIDPLWQHKKISKKLSTSTAYDF